ncbi:MAG TPA: MaoC family dehydratase N-terminal domain-containing protein, partial [Acidimicrobiales bacterium]|nr:MaoC family dehydratase N-terminal domain-containing protein [Acidimicrobiales bacterium]
TVEGDPGDAVVVGGVRDRLEVSHRDTLTGRTSLVAVVPSTPVGAAPASRPIDREGWAATMGTVDEVLKGMVGRPTHTSTVVVERGPVMFFADAVLETDPAYRTPAGAAAAGLPGIPAPPTYPFVMETWGTFPEIQPADAPPPAGLLDVLGPLLADGGLILHGEQEFTYHRPVLVGDVLVGRGAVVDAYQKVSKDRTMTFVVVRTDWTDQATGEPVVTSTFNVIYRV